MNTRKSDLRMKAVYSEPGVEYACHAFGATVVLDCLWQLGHDQGGEGQLYPGSTEVLCSQAACCAALRDGRCPLTHEDNDDLNGLEVRVMKGRPPQVLIEDGSVIEVGEPRADGFVIWFGVANVAAPAEE